VEKEFFFHTTFCISSHHIMASHHIEAGSSRPMHSGKHFGPQLPKTPEQWFVGDRLFIVLEMASLETVKTRRGFELLNSQDHHVLLNRAAQKSGKPIDVSMYRPDIVHQVLMTLLDSPLNKAGKLKIFIHTQKNVLIDVNPKLRIPRTYNRFAGLMVQLLYQFRIRSVKGNEKLLRVVKNPVTRHLPPGARIFGTSKTGALVNVNKWVPESYADKTFRKGMPAVMVFGAHPKGKIQNVDYVQDEDWIAVSQYALSSSAAISRTLGAFEQHWNVL